MVPTRVVPKFLPRGHGFAGPAPSIRTCARGQRLPSSPRPGDFASGHAVGGAASLPARPRCAADLATRSGYRTGALGGFEPLRPQCLGRGGPAGGRSPNYRPQAAGTILDPGEAFGRLRLRSAAPQPIGEETLLASCLSDHRRRLWGRPLIAGRALSVGPALPFPRTCSSSWAPAPAASREQPSEPFGPWQDVVPSGRHVVAGYSQDSRAGRLPTGIGCSRPVNCGAYPSPCREMFSTDSPVRPARGRLAPSLPAGPLDDTSCSVSEMGRTGYREACTATAREGSGSGVAHWRIGNTMHVLVNAAGVMDPGSYARLAQLKPSPCLLRAGGALSENELVQE